MKRLRKINYHDHEWKKNPNAILVSRPSQWGNPYTIKEYGLRECLRLYRIWLINMIHIFPNFLEPLKGKDLVCYCHLAKPCHADILIEFVEKITLDDFGTK